MAITSLSRAMVALVLLGLAPGAWAQSAAGASAAPTSEADIRNVLLWNSPWEGRGTTQGRVYSYRTVFLQRRDALIAEVIAYATNQRTDSVVSIRDGRVTWQDANGADVAVAFADGGDLVGTATLQNNNMGIVLKPRR